METSIPAAIYGTLATLSPPVQDLKLMKNTYLQQVSKRNPTIGKYVPKQVPKRGTLFTGIFMILWIGPVNGPSEAKEPQNGPRGIQGPSKLIPKGSKNTFEPILKTPKTVFLPTRDQHGGGN